MKVALAQIDVIAGRPKKNLETMLRLIEEAKKKGVDLISFPEMCVGGYLVGDKFCDESFCANLMRFNEKIMKASKGIAVAYGNVFMETDIQARVGDNKPHPNKDGRLRKYNAVYIFQDGKPVKRLKETEFIPSGVQPKTLLPNYRIFDDERYFFSLKDVAQDFGVRLEELLSPFVIHVKGEKIAVGFEICEDLWCEDYRKDLEALNPTKILIENGAEYIVNGSASPWTFGKNAARDRRIQFLKKESGKNFKPFFYVNCVGAQNNGKNIITFDGGSTIYNSNGEPVVLSEEAYKEELIIVEPRDLEGKVLERKEEKMIAQKYRAIVRGIQHLKDSAGAEEHPKFVIGLSGGVDSAISAALLSQAVGRYKVFGINMPTHLNSDKTKDAARKVAESLGTGYRIVSIQELADLNERVLDSLNFDGKGRGLTAVQKGNVAAKIRGTSVLSNIAAKYGALFPNNGNKWEVSVGYATLYGDVNGALCPLADLTKAEVFDMARYLNEEVFRREVIPYEVIPDALYRFREDQIEPSAELEEKQVDPIKTGYHDALLMGFTDFKIQSAEDVMRHYIQGDLHEVVEKYLDKEKGFGLQLMKRWGVDDAKEFIQDLDWFDRMMHWAVFKRVQTPPIIITSKTAYGYDRRESILPYELTFSQEELKEKILRLNKYTPGGKYASVTL